MSKWSKSFEWGGYYYRYGYIEDGDASSRFFLTVDDHVAETKTADFIVPLLEIVWDKDKELPATTPFLPKDLKQPTPKENNEVDK